MTFRSWLQQKWYQHMAEVEEWTGRLPSYPIDEYFKRYKWWLKREFQHQRRKG